MDNNDKKDKVVRCPLTLIHHGQCRGSMVFQFLSTTSDRSLHVEGYCATCHEQLSYDWPFSELIAHCPPSPTPKPVPVPKFLPLGEIFTDADKLFLKDMKCLSQ